MSGLPAHRKRWNNHPGMARLTTRSRSRTIASKRAQGAERRGYMDWKEQLREVVREGGIEFLDIRFICIKQQEQWFLRRFRATAYHADPSVPELVQYPSYLFLRQK